MMTPWEQASAPRDGQQGMAEECRELRHRPDAERILVR